MEQSKQIGDFSFVSTPVGTFAYQFPTYETTIPGLMDSVGWDDNPVTVAGIRVIPWGADNNLPNTVRNLLEKNNLGPGILDRKIGLLYGQGPALCRYRYENNERVQEWIEDEEIQEWLDSWDYRRFIRECLMEYNHLKGVFVKYISARRRRLGQPWIHSLECMPSSDCRLEWPENDSRRIEDVRHILYGDFAGFTRQQYRLYPVFDRWNPAQYDTAIKYHSMRSFGRNFYAISSFYGSIPWMKDANNLPRIIEYLNKNMIAAAYIVHVPDTYWKRKEDLIKEKNPEITEVGLSLKMDEYKRELARDIADVMAGTSNVGKFFMTVDFLDPDGHAQSWKIEPIELNIDKYIEALSKISTIADSSTTSGFGLNPSLANIIIDGKGDSGSQMLYALKLFYGADTQIPEDICLEAINDSIRINFPHKKGIFLSLYRKVINKEDNVTASSRTTNQV